VRARPASLWIFLGAGGVGKTTLAAGAALGAARDGADTLVMTFDPSERLKDVLGVGNAVHDREVEVIDADTPGAIHASVLDAQATFDRIVTRHAPDTAARERILRNRFYAHLSGGLGGILEYMAVERLYEVAQQHRHERVVLDTPPVRQALDFLDAPARIVGFLDSGAVEIAQRRWFDAKGRLRAAAKLGPLGRGLEKFLDNAVGLDLLREVAEFFQAFGPLYAGFRQRANEVRDLLREPATTFVLVTSPGSERVPETLFFVRKLVERGHRVGAVVVNRVHPAARPGAKGDQDPTRTLIAWLAERDRRGLCELRDLLKGGPPVIELPVCGEPPSDLASLEAIGRDLLERWRP
jgi:anion-transporting  ArsA/GET3 family ATPase